MQIKDLTVGDRIRFRWRTFSKSTHWMEDSANIVKIDENGIWTDLTFPAQAFLIARDSDTQILCKEIPITLPKPLNFLFVLTNAEWNCGRGMQPWGTMGGQVSWTDNQEMPMGCALDIKLPWPLDHRFGSLKMGDKFTVEMKPLDKK